MGAAEGFASSPRITSAGSHRQVSLSLRAKRSNLLPLGEYGGDMKKYLTAMAALLLLAAPAGAADNVKIGCITTLSGPAAIIDTHMKDARALAISMLRHTIS